MKIGKDSEVPLSPLIILVVIKKLSNLEALRKAKFNELSLKCTLNVIRAKYKTSFFFRTIQEWNRLPPDIRKLENSEKFEQKLLEHINKQAFCFEIEPD